MINKSRIEWIDSLRAIAMIFVIYGHMDNSSWTVFLLTNPIKIPLFFAISGYLSKSNMDVLPKIKKTALSILVPYFFLSLFPFKLIASLMPFTVLQPSETLDMFFSGKYLWYLPCCFAAEQIFYLTIKYIKKNRLIIIICFIITALGFALSKTALGNTLYISNALISQMFLLIGYEIKKYETKLAKIGNKTIIAFTAIYIALGCVSMHLFPKQSISAQANYYYHIPLSFAMIFIGCLTIILAFKKNNIHCKVLTFIGQNTLAYYAFNKYFRSPVIFIFSLMGISLNINWWVGILLTIGCCTFCAPISILFNNLFPFCVAKRKKQSFQIASVKKSSVS